MTALAIRGFQQPNQTKDVIIFISPHDKYQMRLKMKSNGETWSCELGGCGIRDEGYRCVWRRRYKETGSRGSTHPARPGGANQQTGRVAAGQTAAHRAQPVLRSPAGHQLVSRDVTTGARRKRMGPGAQRNNKQFVKGRTGRNVTESE